MTSAMRQILARQPFEQKIEKVGQLIALSRRIKALRGGQRNLPVSAGTDYVTERDALFVGETVDSLFEQAADYQAK